MDVSVQAYRQQKSIRGWTNSKAALGNRTADHSATQSLFRRWHPASNFVTTIIFVTEYPNLSIPSAFLDKNILFTEVMFRYEVKR